MNASKHQTPAADSTQGTRVRFEVRDRVGYVRLDGPKSMNSLTYLVLDGLEDVAAQVEAGSGVHALVITGVGRAFSVGMDLDFLGECFADPGGVFIPFTHRYHALLSRLEALPVPIIAAVNGLTRAGGFELLLACDLVIASRSAKVADHHIEFGIVPGAGATARAVRKMGDQRARELLFTGRWLKGDELVDAGLALCVVEDEDLMAEAESLAATMTGRSPQCLAAMKRLVTMAGDEPLEDVLQAERDEFARFHTEVEDSDEGYRAWVEKRAPRWSTR